MRWMYSIAIQITRLRPDGISKSGVRFLGRTSLLVGDLSEHARPVPAAISAVAAPGASRPLSRTRVGRTGS